MNKKLWFGFVAVYLVLAILDWIVNTMLMASAYASTTELWRPEGEIKMWVIFVCYAFFAFFFTFIFSKGYEGKGIWEGVRFGLYVSGLMAIPAAYISYAMMPLPYSLAFQWFIYTLVEYVAAGIVLAVIFGKKEAAATA
jgi:hypothetical protein